MYESIRIQNFRGLKDLTIENLGRVNLLVGANNVGKTSVLEALWLLNGYGNPNLGTATATYRGVEERLNPVDVWRGLVHGAVLSKGEAVIEAISNSQTRESLSIRFDPGPASGSAASVPDPSHFVNERPNDFGSLTFARANGLASNSSEASISLSNLGFSQSLVPVSGRSAMLVSAVRWLSARDLAVAFTLADDLGQLPALERAVSALEPRVERLSLGLSGNEETPSVRVHLSGERTAMPLYLLGTGIDRLVHLLFGLVLHRGGMALIDEVDMGVYYRSLGELWNSIDLGISAMDTQLFATTHSWECVEAAIKVYDGFDADDFRLIRLERDGNDIRAISGEHRQVEATVALGFDVR